MMSAAENFVGGYPQAYDGKVRFDVWESHLDIFFRARKIENDKEKAIVLLQHIGINMFEKIYDWVAPRNPQELKYVELVELLRNMLCSKPHLFSQRMKFFNEKQQAGQPIHEYLAYMMQLYGQCAMHDMKAEDFGILAILRGIADEEMKQYIMLPTNKIGKIGDMQQLANAFEQSRIAARDLSNDGKSDTAKINVVSKNDKGKCYGGAHLSGKSKDKSCSTCGLEGHLAKVCWNKDMNDSDSGDESRCEAMNGVYRMNTTFAHRQSSIPRPKLVNVKVNGRSLTFQKHVSSSASLINERIWRRLGSPELLESQLGDYEKANQVLGKCKVFVKSQGVTAKLWITVVKKGYCKLGKDWMQAMKINANKGLHGPCNQTSNSNVHASMQGKVEVNMVEVQHMKKPKSELMFDHPKIVPRKQAKTLHAKNTEDSNDVWKFNSIVVDAEHNGQEQTQSKDELSKLKKVLKKSAKVVGKTILKIGQTIENIKAKVLGRSSVNSQAIEKLEAIQAARIKLIKVLSEAFLKYKMIERKAYVTREQIRKVMVHNSERK